MTDVRLPQTAAWRHLGARDGFEVLFVGEHDGCWRFRGSTSAVEEGEPWTVSYALDVDDRWRLRAADVTNCSASGVRSIGVRSDGEGRWHVDGVPRPELDGCLDLDLESSAFTNALPVHRLTLPPGAEAQAPAAYVRAVDLALERLEQRYLRLADDGRGQRYDYESPAFDFRCVLVYDDAGLVLDYPGIAVRAA